MTPKATISMKPPESVEPSVAGQDPFLNKKKAEEKARAAADAVPIRFPPCNWIWVVSRQRASGEFAPLLASPTEAEAHRLNDLFLTSERRKAGRYAVETEDGWSLIIPPKFKKCPVFEIVPEV